MLGESQQKPQRLAPGTGPRNLDIRQALATDLAANRMSMASQQHRRKAVQYTPARVSAQQGTPNNNTAATHAALYSQMPTSGDYTQPNHHQPHPSMQRHQQHQQHQTQPQLQPLHTYSVSPGATPPRSVASDKPHESDNVEEELYLRRVSVLYHELWNGDWIDRQLFGSGPLSLGIDATTGYIGTGDSFLGELGATTTAQTIDIIDTIDADTTMSQTADNSASTSIKAVDNEQELPSKVSTDAQTIVGTTAQPDNCLPQTSSRIPSGDIHAEKQRVRFPELQTSWCSLGDETCAEQDSPVLAPIRDSAPVSIFSSSDLVDALVGTVHRLEDDKQLLQRKRWSVIKELAITEAHYLRDLLLLRAVFYEPLAGPSGSGLLRSEDIRVVFGNLDEVIDCARSFIEYLTVAVVYEANRCCALSDGEIQSSGPSYKYEDKPERRSAMPMQWNPPNHAAGHTELAHPPAGFGTKANEVGLRSSAWAEISIAQAFLLTSQRMERVYSEYCHTFEAATQRLVEIKHVASTVSISALTPSTMPTTPITTYHQVPLVNSPFAEPSKGLRLTNGVFPNFSGSGPSARGSGNAASSGIASGNSNLNVQLERWDPEDVYSAMVYQFLVEQAQLLAGKTTSWDLSSLLIKPVQRILKYPLLIRTLLSLTRVHTSDHGQLEKAAQTIEGIAENINSVNSTAGLRISTATSASVGSAPNDDSQNRITRELRRVLRRRPGNPGHPHSKSTPDNVTSARQRLTMRPKSRSKDSAEPPIGAGGVSGNTSSSVVETLVEQHELRISELIRSLRQWESNLGSMLSQQVALAGRWRDFYTLSARDTGSITAAETHFNSLPTEGCVQSGGEPLDANEMVYREYSWHQQQQQLTQNVRYSNSGRLYNHQLGPRASKSYNVLRAHSSFVELDINLLETTPATQIPDNCNTASSNICTSKLEWQSLKRGRVVQYHAALEKVYKSVYPRLICNALLSNIYPVLNSLLQVYSDGPRRILSEITRISNSSDLYQHPSSDCGEDRVVVLHNALAADLPKLFEHERTIVRLLAKRIVTLKHEFYLQTSDILSAARGDIDFNITLADSAPFADVTSRISSLADLSTRAQTPGLLTSLKQSPGTTSHSERMKAIFEKQIYEPINLGLGQSLPSSADHTSQIQSGIWLLAQDVGSRSSAHYPLKDRWRESTAESTFSLDSLSDSSIALNECPNVSMFEATPPGVARAKQILPGYGGGSYPTLLISASRNATTFQAEGSDTLDNDGMSRPLTAKPRRKKSNGFIDRISNFKPGRAVRTHLGLSQTNSQFTDKDYGSADQVKSRAQPGSNSIVSEYNEGLFISNSHRVMSDIGLCGRDGKGGWSNDTTKYEPLPLVNHTRFSKGFVDETFRFLTLRQDSVTGTSDPSGVYAVEEGVDI